MSQVETCPVSVPLSTPWPIMDQDIVSATTTTKSVEMASALRVLLLSEPEVQRVTAGLCRGSELCDIITMDRSCGTSRGVLELACCRLFEAAVSRRPGLAKFVYAMMARNVKVRIADDEMGYPAWIITTTAELGQAQSASLLCQLAEDREIELVGTVCKPIGRAHASEVAKPLILAAPTQCSDACAMHPDNMHGILEWLFAASGVCAVFELVHGPGQSLFACVRCQAAPVPARGERIVDYARRVTNQSSMCTTAVEITLVHCMINCAYQDLGCFCGISVEVLVRSLAELLYRSKGIGKSSVLTAPNCDNKLALTLEHLFRNQEFTRAICCTHRP